MLRKSTPYTKNLPKAKRPNLRRVRWRVVDSQMNRPCPRFIKRTVGCTMQGCYVPMRMRIALASVPYIAMRHR
jgi:hypothetical protein